MPEYVPLQPWHCEKCRRAGAVEMPQGTDTWDGCQLILADHRTKSPACHQEFGVKYVRAVPTGGAR